LHIINTCKLDYNVNDGKQYKCCDAVSQVKRIVKFSPLLQNYLQEKR